MRATRGGFNRAIFSISLLPRGMTIAGVCAYYSIHDPSMRATERVTTPRRAPLMKPLLLASLLLIVCMEPAMAQGADPNLARNIAASCANCHGTNGVSQGGIPSLAGQAKADLARKMQDYKAGRTQGTIMPQLAKGYTDEQIELMAGWFAAQKP
jgi:cytochrome subunit of sulfide dehydrogenase